MAFAAIAAAIALAGCDTDGTPTLSGRHMQPLSDRMVAEIERKNMEKESAILVRIFKQESGARSLEGGPVGLPRAAQDLSDLPLVR